MIDNFRNSLYDRFDVSYQREKITFISRIKAVLVYETADILLSPFDGDTAAVFNAAPEENGHQLSRLIIGDRDCNLEFVEVLFREIIEAVTSVGGRVIFKPKSSILNYLETYQMMTSKKKVQLKNRFFDFISLCSLWQCN